MDAKGFRNMQSILVVVNEHNTARVASCWFIIYYRHIVLFMTLTIFNNSDSFEFYGLTQYMFLLIKTNCEPEDDLR